MACVTILSDCRISLSRTRYRSYTSPFGAQGDLEIELLVARIGIGLPDVVVDAAARSAGPVTP